MSLATICPCQHPNRVYCAGPLFNEAERQEMLRIARVLADAGFEPFVPHADGMEFAQVRPYLVSQGYLPEEVGQLLHEAIFALDTYQVVLGCGSLVFNMNGRVPDEGGVAELTMAWTLGKPVVIYKEDVRSAIAARDNPLIVGQTGFEVITDLEQLPETLSSRIGEDELLSDWRVPCPPRLQSTLTAGRRLWQELHRLGATRPSDRVAEIVLEIFGGRDRSGAIGLASA